jgi:hypothetical protein
MERADVRMREAIAYGARAGAERGRALMVKRTPTDLGQLKAGWKVRVTGSVASDAVAIGGGNEVELAALVNDAPHIAIVELGGDAPGDALAEGSELLSRTDDLRETARLRPTRYRRGRTLGCMVAAGQPAPGDEVVWLAP